MAASATALGLTGRRRRWPSELELCCLVACIDAALPLPSVFLCLPEKLVEARVLREHSLDKPVRKIQGCGVLDEGEHILQVAETIVLWVEALAEILVKIKRQVRLVEAWSIGVVDVTPE